MPDDEDIVGGDEGSSFGFGDVLGALQSAQQVYSQYVAPVLSNPLVQQGAGYLGRQLGFIGTPPPRPIPRLHPRYAPRPLRFTAPRYAPRFNLNQNQPGRRVPFAYLQAKGGTSVASQAGRRVVRAAPTGPGHAPPRQGALHPSGFVGPGGHPRGGPIGPGASAPHVEPFPTRPQGDPKMGAADAAALHIVAGGAGAITNYLVPGSGKIVAGAIEGVGNAIVAGLNLLGGGDDYPGALNARNALVDRSKLLSVNGEDVRVGGASGRANVRALLSGG